MSANLQQVVAATADTADLHAPAPTLLLELQTLLGALSATVTAATERGRRPFRPGTDWAPRLASSPTACTCWPTRPGSTSTRRST